MHCNESLIVLLHISVRCQRALRCLAVGLGMWLGALHSQLHGAENTPSVISFELKKPGNVSAAIYDSGGHVVRELLHAVPKNAGKDFLVWDGLDRDGNSVPAGDYTWKLLQTSGLKTAYVMSIGSNYPPGNDWRHAGGPGTHAAPFGVAVDKSGIYVAANTTENIETCVLKMDPDGKSRLWSVIQPRPWDGALSMAIDGGELFMLGHNVWVDGRTPELPKRQILYVYDAATGALAPRTEASTALGGVPVKIDVHWDTATEDIDASDMDIHNGVLVVSYDKRNGLRWYDPKTGEKLDTTEIPAPQGIAVSDNGTVYISTENRVVTLSREKKTPVDFVTGLEKPGRLDIDHGTGEILIYLQGTQQIKRFSAAGKLLNTYGASGGRKQGIYDETTKRNFAEVADLCADGTGGFYITEYNWAPRRTAHLNSEGVVLQEWYGGQRWAPHAAFEGDNPNVLWVGSQYGWIMRVLVDYTTKTWKVHSCYKYADLADGLVGDSHNEGGFFRVYQHDGVTYLSLEKMPTILKVDEKNCKLTPVTICGGVAQLPPSIKDAAKNNQSYQWNDANADGLPQPEEFTFYAVGFANSYEPTITSDFSCFTVADEMEGRRVHRFTVDHWNKVGAPVYGDMPQGTVFGTCSPRFDRAHFADTRWSAFLHRDAKSGRLYAALNDWTRDWCDYNDSFMQQWSAGGAPTWTVGQRPSGKALPGEIKSHLRGIAGTAHDCVIAIDVDGGWLFANLAVSYVWDQDGLYVGGVMDAPDLNGIEKYWYQCSGESCHSSVHTLPGGDVLFLQNWENEMRIYRISGWDGWTRQSGAIHLAKPVAAHTGQGLSASYFDDRAMTKLRTSVVEPQIDRTWDSQHPAPAAVRWVGTIQPEYGPTYTGRWLLQSDKACFDGTSRSARDNNVSVTFRFHGTSVSVVGNTGPNFGNLDFSLDGETQPRFDCYSSDFKRDVSLFTKTGLPSGDHEVKATVVGWYGQPRNSASSDALVMLDKFLVDGQEFDDAGISYTFATNADGKLNLWLNREPVIQDQKIRESRADVVAKTIKLLRMPNPIQLDYTGGANAGGVKLFWSSPLEPKQVVPTKCLYPVTPGGYTMENVRYVGQ